MFVDFTESVFPVSLHILLLFLCFRPFEKVILLVKQRRFISPSIDTLVVLSFFLMVINIPVEIISLLEIRDTLQSTWYDLGAVRQDFYAGENVFRGSFNYSVVISATSTFAVGVLFEMLKYKGIVFHKVMMFIVSLHIVIENLKYMSRDGLFIWCIVSVCCYLLYKDSLPHKTRARLLKYGIIIFILGSILFTLITISRASILEGAMHDSQYFFIRYLGQPFLNFTLLYREDFVLHTVNMDRNVFSTFVYPFVHNYGIFFSIVFAVIYNVLLNRLSNTLKNFNYINMLLALFYFFGFGVLYMHYYFQSRTTLLPMAIYFMLVFVLDNHTKISKLTK